MALYIVKSRKKADFSNFYSDFHNAYLLMALTLSETEVTIRKVSMWPLKRYKARFTKTEKMKTVPI